MKWLFVKRTEQNSPFCMQHYLGKLLLKASYWAGRASTRTLAIIPNYSALISPCILWFSLYSSNVTREHQVQVTVSGSGMLTLHAGEGKEVLLIPSHSLYWSLRRHLSPSLKHRAFNEAFKWSVTGRNNADCCQALAKGKRTKQYHKARWGRQQSWKQKKETARKLGWSSMLQTAVRTAATFLGTCYGSLRLALVCSRKNPKLPPPVTVIGYLWSSSKLCTKVVFSSGRFSSASVAICHKSCQKLSTTSAGLVSNIHKEENFLKTEHFQWNQGARDRKSKSLNCNTASF